ncbi:MAG: hypothetical protein N2646_05965 [Bellilinea sp.]|nr:hypothetical protein [Bellilinea sp.]
MDELTPEELDALAREGERLERERSKQRLLALLQNMPADNEIWDQVLVLVTGILLLEAREEA